MSLSAGRGPGQLSWYMFASRFVVGKTVLDVGCGLGKGMEILRQSAASVHGQDLDPRLKKVGVRICPIDQIPSKSYDVVTSIDVIEHVPDDARFVNQLARVARHGLFLSSPNWTAGRCRWPYHIREYTPQQWNSLFSHVGNVVLYKGTSSGDGIYRVTHPRAYFTLNTLRTLSPTSFAARCLNKLIPESCRIQSHNAAWIELTS